MPGIVRSERDIAPVLDEVFANAAQRIIVACFASHVHRVQQVLDTAAKHRRKVAFVGRSMVRNMGVARDLGYLRVPGGMLIDLRDAEEMPPGEVVLISTGSQGEPMSALSRMAGRDHPIRIAAGDTVDPRLQPDPRQRDRRLPGDQRADQARRPRGAQGVVAWCT